jgi:beta-lactam-binding protein with PASTA domain
MRSSRRNPQDPGGYDPGDPQDPNYGQGYPQETDPNAGYYQGQGYPQQGYPQQGYPQQGYPQGQPQMPTYPPTAGYPAAPGYPGSAQYPAVPQQGYYPQPGMTGPALPTVQAPMQQPVQPVAPPVAQAAPARRMRAEELEDEEGYERSKGTRVGLVIGVSFLTSLLTGGGLHLLLGGAAAADKVTVPAIVGLTLEKAKLTSESAKLSVNVAGNTSDPLIEKGSVAKQSPLAGTAVVPGSTLSVILSTGPSSVTLPSFQGLSVSQAIERLQKLGVKVGTTRFQSNSGLADGLVVTTEPAPGSVLQPETTVSLIVSHQEAAAATPAAGGPTVETGAAAPGPAKTAPGAPVTLKAAPGMVIVPKVVGVRLQFATSRLSSSGLSAGRVTYEKDEDHMEDFVMRQSPEAGTQVPRGSSVDLVVERGE